MMVDKYRKEDRIQKKLRYSSARVTAAARQQI